MAAAVLGVAPDAEPAEVRRAYRRRLVDNHPDLTGSSDPTGLHRVIEAYSILSAPPPDEPVADPPPVVTHLLVGSAPLRLDSDTIAVAAPADETFRLLLDAAHDVGEITYLDRSVPIVEVLCRFVDEPATSLVLTVQGRASHTEVFCTVESIEDRPAPPTAAVVDLLEDAISLHCAGEPRAQPPDSSGGSG